MKETIRYCSPYSTPTHPSCCLLASAEEAIGVWSVPRFCHSYQTLLHAVHKKLSQVPTRLWNNLRHPGLRVHRFVQGHRYLGM